MLCRDTVSHTADNRRIPRYTAVLFVLHVAHLYVQSAVPVPCFNSTRLQFVRRAVKRHRRNTAALWMQANQFSLEVRRVPAILLLQLLLLPMQYGLITVRCHSNSCHKRLSDAVNSRNWTHRMMHCQSIRGSICSLNGSKCNIYMYIFLSPKSSNI